MTIIRLSCITLLLLIANAQFTLAQQFKQRKVFVKKEMSLSKADNKIVTASETIVFESGFEAKEGCSFYASVIDTDDRTNTWDINRESLVAPFSFDVYPTITTSKVNLKISGAASPVITICDEKHGTEIFHSNDSTLSQVDLGMYGKVIYVIKIVSGEDIVFRRVIVM